MIVCLLWFAIAPPTVRSTDAEGEPLPPGAMIRLGSVRWAGWLPRGVFTPEGDAVLFLPGGDAPVELRDLATGRKRPFPLVRQVQQVGFDRAGKTLTLYSFKPAWEQQLAGLGEPSALVVLRRYEWPGLRELGSHAIDPANEYPHLSPDGRYLLRRPTEGRSIYLEEPLSGARLATLVESKTDWYSARFSREGRWVVIRSYERGLILYDLQNHKIAHRLRVDGLSWSEDLVALASSDQRVLMVLSGKTLLRVDLKAGKITHRVTLPAEGSILFTPKGKELLWTFRDQIRRLDPATLESLGEETRTENLIDIPIAFRDDGKFMLRQRLNRLEILEVATGRALEAVAGHHGRIVSLAFSPDGEEVVSGDYLGEVRIWDRATGALKRRLRHSQGICSFAFRDDGNLLAIAGHPPYGQAQPSMVELWPRDAVKPTLRFAAHVGDVHTMAFNRKGDRLITFSKTDERIRWWDATTGKRLSQVRHLPFRPQLLEIRDEQVTVADYLAEITRYGPDGGMAILAPGSRENYPTWYVSGGRTLLRQEKKVTWVDPRTGKAIMGPRLPEIKDENGDQLREFSPSGEQVVYATVNEHVLWDLTHQFPLLRFATNRSEFPTFAFSRDGRWLAIVDRWTGIAIFEVPQLVSEKLMGPWLTREGGTTEVLELTPRGVERLGEMLRRADRLETAAASLLPLLADDDFATREATHKRLARMGPSIAALLETTRKTAPELEIRLRCARLLNALHPDDRRLWSDPKEFKKMLIHLNGRSPGQMQPLLKRLSALEGESLVKRSARALIQDKGDKR